MPDRDARPEYRPNPKALVAGAGLLGRFRRGRLDETTAAIVGLLTDAGVSCLLLRGPVIARELYEVGDDRSYGDSDLLVPASQHEAAERVLAANGFSAYARSEALSDESWHALTWMHEDGATTVDLHRTLRGCSADPEHVWRVLIDDATTMQFGASSVRVPGRAGIALIVALHAAEHGPRWSRPKEDLERAMERLSVEDWSRAASLARRLGAAGAMRAGVERVQGGEAFADRLGLEVAGAEDLLRATARDGMAVNLQNVAAARGIGAKARLLAMRIWPPAEGMRQRHPLARRGRVGLAAAYLGRPFVLARRLPKNVRVWWAARRETKR